MPIRTDHPALHVADEAAPTGLRHRLRIATGPAHRRLDMRLDRFDLSRLTDYRQFLAINAAALLPLEDALLDAGVIEEFPDWPQRSRTAAILSDLARLDSKPQPLRQAAPLDSDGVLGTMYVLEGSRLGAKILLRTVTNSSDPLVAGTTEYLRHGAGQDLWRSFLVTLGKYAPVSSEAGVVNAALRAFTLFDEAAACASEQTAFVLA